MDKVRPDADPANQFTITRDGNELPHGAWGRERLGPLAAESKRGKCRSAG